MTFFLGFGLTQKTNLLFFAVPGFVALGWHLLAKRQWKKISPGLVKVLLLFALYELLSAGLSIYRPNAARHLLFCSSAMLIVMLFATIWKRPEVFRKVMLLLVPTGAAFALIFIGNVWHVHLEALDTGLSDMMTMRNKGVPFLDDANSWSSFMLSFLPFGVAAAFSRSRPLSIAGLVAVGFLVLSVLLCFSRGAMAALLGFILTMLAGVFILRSRDLIGRAAVIFVLAFAVPAVLAAIPFGSELKSSVQLSSTTSQERSLENRKSGLQVAQESLREYPVTGGGSGNFQILYSRYFDPPFDIPMRIQAGGQVTKILVEKGLLGVLVYGLLILTILWSSLKTLQNTRVDDATRVTVLALVAGFVAMLLRDATLPVITQKNVVLFMFAAIVGLLISHLAAAATQPAERFKWRTPAVASLVLLAAVMTAYYGVNLLFDRMSKEVDSQMRSGNYASAGSIADATMKLLPAHALSWYHRAGLQFNETCNPENTPWSVEAMGCSDTSLVPNIVSDLQMARSLCPDDETLLSAMAFVYLSSGRADSAQLLASRAAMKERRIPLYPVIEVLALLDQGSSHITEPLARALSADPDLWLSPFAADVVAAHRVEAYSALTRATEIIDREPESPILRARKGALQLFAGDTAGASNLLEAALAELPGLNRPYYYLGQIYLMRGDTAKAFALFGRSIILDPRDPLPVYHLEYLKNGKPAAVEAARRIEVRFRESHYAKKNLLYRGHVIPQLIPTMEFNTYLMADPELAVKALRRSMEK